MVEVCFCVCFFKFNFIFNKFPFLPPVPIRELPNYSQRRKMSSMTPSMRSLVRSRSDPRLHASVLEERMRAATSQQNLTTLSDFCDSASNNPSGTASYPSSHDYNSDSPCSLSVSSASSGPRKLLLVLVVVVVTAIDHNAFIEFMSIIKTGILSTADGLVTSCHLV